MNEYRQRVSKLKTNTKNLITTETFLTENNNKSVRPFDNKFDIFNFQPITELCYSKELIPSKIFTYTAETKPRALEPSQLAFLPILNTISTIHLLLYRTEALRYNLQGNVKINLIISTRKPYRRQRRLSNSVANTHLLNHPIFGERREPTGVDLQIFTCE